MYNEYYTPYDDNSYQQMYNDDIERKMHGQKRIALQKLSSKAVQLNEALSLLLVYSFGEGFPIAERIVRELNLSKLDLLSLGENFEEFKEEYISDNEKWGTFE